jgi:hypothetical protein
VHLVLTANRWADPRQALRDSISAQNYSLNEPGLKGMFDDFSAQLTASSPAQPNYSPTGVPQFRDPRFNWQAPLLDQPSVLIDGGPEAL